MAVPDTHSELRSRFVTLWKRCRLIDGDGADPGPVWNGLLASYSEVHRHYHGICHLEHCLEQHDLASDRMDDPDAVEMAIWFHDIILEPQAPDNEQRSAELFQRVAAGAFDREFIGRVIALIMATTHREAPLTPDEAVMVDIDLSSFGLPWEGYLRDTLALRRENPQLPDARYYRAHRGFLDALRGRTRIFFTDFFYRRYETGARDNIDRYLGKLDSTGFF